MSRTRLRERKYRDEIEQFQKIFKSERDAWLKRELRYIVPGLVYDWILCTLPAASRYLEEQNIRWEIGKFIALSKTWTRLTVDLYKGTEVKATMEFDIEHDGSHDHETLHNDVWELKK